MAPSVATGSGLRVRFATASDQILSAAWSPHEKAPAASAKQFAARRLRAAVVACGAVGAGAARGAATKAVKSAPCTIYRRGSCHPEADRPSDFFTASEQWLAPRPQPLQRSTAPVKKRERAILSLFRRLEGITDTHIHGSPAPLSSPSPSAVASLQKLRAEVGSKGDGRNAKAEPSRSRST